MPKNSFSSLIKKLVGSNVSSSFDYCIYRYYVLCFFILCQVMATVSIAEERICTGLSTIVHAQETESIPRDFIDFFAVELLSDNQVTTIRKECLISISDFSMNKDNYLWVDVRDGIDLNFYLISGAINIPISEIPRKPFLQDKAIVLLDHIYNYARLKELCLSPQKYNLDKVMFLEGGLEAWVLSGNKLIGSQTNKVHRVSVEDFYVLPNKKDWIIIGLGLLDRQYTFSEHIKFSKHIKLVADTIDAEALKTLVFNAIKQYKSHYKKMPNILLVNNGAEPYPDMSKYLNKKYLPYLFYMEGGLSEFANFAVKTQKMWAQSKKSYKINSHCGSMS